MENHATQNPPPSPPLLCISVPALHLVSPWGCRAEDVPACCVAGSDAATGWGAAVWGEPPLHPPGPRSLRRRGPGRLLLKHPVRKGCGVLGERGRGGGKWALVRHGTCRLKSRCLTPHLLFSKHPCYFKPAMVRMAGGNARRVLLISSSDTLDWTHRVLFLALSANPGGRERAV